MIVEWLLAEAERENAKADAARGSQVEDVALECVHRGKALAYLHLAWLLSLGLLEEEAMTDDR